MHTRTFWKTILRNQAHAQSWPTISCGHTPGLTSRYTDKVQNRIVKNRFPRQTINVMNDMYFARACHYT